MSADRVIRAARRAVAAYRELRDGEGRVSLTLQLEDLEAAVEAHDEAESLAALRDGRCIDVETTEVRP